MGWGAWVTTPKWSEGAALDLKASPVRPRSHLLGLETIQTTSEG